MPRTVIVRAPTRIDLGGGWTDVPPYCDREGGFVCNIAIDHYATATVTSRVHGKGGSIAGAGEEGLVNAVFRRLRMRGVRMTLRSEYPVGSGLGGSSSASAALCVAAAEWKEEPWDRAAVAEFGRTVEVEDLGIAGGRQDHYAATFGGALGLTFTDKVDVRRLDVSEATLNELAERSFLIYTGQSRVSGETITSVLDAYEKGEKRVIDALSRMKALAREMAAALERGDVDAVGRLVGEHWHFQRDLHPSIPTPQIDQIISTAKSLGALGAKAMGASGGGCVLVIGTRENVDQLRMSLFELGGPIEFQADLAGVTVWRPA